MFGRWKAQRKFFVETHGKYDIRYFRAELGQQTVIAALTDALRAFMVVSARAGVAPFLGHGTLIGWWWSRNLLPWDDDIDLLITYDGLLGLLPLHGQLFEDRYLLEINPNHVNRKTRNRSFHEYREPNVIDGRFIDTANGLYIDITAFSRIGGGRLSTKCPHVFPSDWLFPLQTATLAGIPVFVPHRVLDVLSRNYGPEFVTRTRINGYVFDQATAMWIKDGA